MRLKYSIIIIISLIIIYPLMGQSFESNVTIVEDFCEGGNGFQPLREYKRHLTVEIFEGWKPPVHFEKSI